MCDRRALGPSDFMPGEFEPMFSALCASHLSQVLDWWRYDSDNGPRRGGWLTCQNGKYWYGSFAKRPITPDEFTAAVAELIESHCRRLDKGLPLHDCEGTWGNGDCGYWAKEQRDGLWLCARHLNHETVAARTKTRHRNKLAERLTAEFLREFV